MVHLINVVLLVHETKIIGRRRRVAGGLKRPQIVFSQLQNCASHPMKFLK